MKIGLLICGSLDTVSGGYYYDRRLRASLQARGHAVPVFSIPWRNYAAVLAGSRSYRLPPGLDLLIQDELSHPALITANRPPHPCPLISLVHHLRSCESHPGWLNFCYRSIEQSYLRSADGFIFNSKTTAQAVHALIGDKAPCLTAYPPTDRFPCTLTGAEVASRARQPGPLRLLFLGNVIPRKGLHTLLAAISGLPAHSICLDVVGSLRADPGYARRVQGQAAALGRQAAITFHGILENGSLQEKLARAQVMVVPSSYEGFGIVYLEGMAFGLPAIGTTAGAAAEIINSAENGYLVPPGDAVSLAANLMALLINRTLLAQLSLHALESYQRWQPWEQTAESISEYLSGMVR
jgi:glycosyltransferase involved in cell wall biosynthesis